MLLSGKCSLQASPCLSFVAVAVCVPKHDICRVMAAEKICAVQDLKSVVRDCSQLHKLKTQIAADVETANKYGVHPTQGDWARSLFQQQLMVWPVLPVQPIFPAGCHTTGAGSSQ